MKTAISLSDTIFRQAERLAKRLRKSRSKLYQDAVEQYIAQHQVDAVTESMNQVLREVKPTADAFLSEAAAETLERTEW